MYGYKVKINCLPQRVWACETTVDDYEWKNRDSKDILEISFSKFDTINITVDNTNYIFKNSLLSCMIADENRTASCESGKPITIVTVAVRLSDFTFNPCEITEADCDDKKTLLLPAFLEDLLLTNELDVIKVLHEIIKLSTNNPENDTAFLAAFFKLLFKIDTITRNSFNKEIESKNYYIKKINYIIESEYNQKLTLQSVASELNISPIYLSAMYKDSSGINFSDQLLNVRMKHAEKLLIDQNIPTSKVAELCGFCDESYFRKKFKQFFGINIREYRQIKNGFTLYHEKPLRKNISEHF